MGVKIINLISIEMKKILFSTFIAIVAIIAWSCSDDDDEQILSDKLPMTAQNFILSYFEETSTDKVERHDSGSKTTYQVWLSNGVYIKFDAIGAWIEVDGQESQALPTGFIPEKIVNLVTTDYPFFSINAIEKISTGYKVTLTDGAHLYFDTDAEFVSYSAT
jgi:hypothetical protein